MRERHRVGLLDVFVILLILLGVIGLILRMQIRYDAKADFEERIVRMRATALHPLTASCLQSGEVLYGEDGEPYGVVERIEAVGARVQISEKGETVVGAWEETEWLDVTIWVRVTGRMGEDGFLRDGTRAVLCGERISLLGERTAISYRVVDCIVP